MKSTLLELHFETTLAERAELVKTRFAHPRLAAERIAVRGKTPGALFEAGSFQWTKGVQALALLILGALCGTPKDEADLTGTRGSAAAALDEAVHKSSLWVLDMFGMDLTGTALAKRLLLRSNTGLRRPGPVSISLNRSFLPLSAVRVVWNGVPVKRGAQLEELIRATRSLSASSPSRPRTPLLYLSARPKSAE